MSIGTTAFRALVRKDIAIFLRDRRALVVSVLTPIVIAAFFGFLFGGNADSVSSMPVGLVDLDGSALSKAVIDGLSHESSLTAQSLPEDQAEQLVRTGKLRAAVVLPVGFGAAASRALFAGRDKPPVKLLYDPSQSFVRAIVEGLLTQHVMQEVTRALFSGDGSSAVIDDSLAQVRASHNLDEAQRAQLTNLLEAVRRFQIDAGQTPQATQQAGALQPSAPTAPPLAATAPQAPGPAPGQSPRQVPGMTVPFILTSTAVSTGPQYNSYSHSFAGMSVQFILFMGIDAGIALLMMRQQGMWRRLRAAPLSRGVLLGSRVVGTTLIAMLILTVVYVVAGVVFGVRISGSVPGFIMVAVAFALLAATTGLMIASVGKSVGATRGVAMFSVLILVMLGGAWVPSFLFPGWLQHVSALAPTRWAVDGLDAMTWRGLPLSAAWAPVAVMMAWAIVFSLIAIWRFDWEGD